MDRLHELWVLVRSIPSGQVVSYGDLGREMSTPTTGRIVGRWLARCPPDLPWWRVVGAQGDLRTSARDPKLGNLQKELLLAEGVKLREGRVPIREHRFEF